MDECNLLFCEENSTGIKISGLKEVGVCGGTIYYGVFG